MAHAFASGIRNWAQDSVALSLSDARAWTGYRFGSIAFGDQLQLQHTWATTQHLRRSRVVCEQRCSSGWVGVVQSWMHRVKMFLCPGVVL